MKKFPIWKKAILITFGALGVVAAGFFLVRSTPHPAEPASATATATQLPADELTKEHGDEVTSIIEKFEIDGHTVKMYKDVDYRATVYTGPYLDYINGYYLSFDENSAWPIVSQATVTRVEVIEYSSQKIRALACVTEQKLDLNSKGKLIKQEPLNSIDGAYVFMNVDGVWKLASFLDMSRPETAKLEYATMDDELKQITGDFDSLNVLACGANP